MRVKRLPRGVAELVAAVRDVRIQLVICGQQTTYEGRQTGSCRGNADDERQVRDHSEHPGHRHRREHPTISATTTASTPGTTSWSAMASAVVELADLALAERVLAVAPPSSRARWSAPR
jgi:hypothetical protein